MTLSPGQRELVARRREQVSGIGISRPMQVIANVRMTPQERASLHAMAAECDITLSWAMREGARLYLEDLRAKLVGQADDEPDLLAG